jgi:preprotein translocase subunit YajC
MGDMLLAATSKSSGGSPFTLILILLVIFGIFYFLMIRPQRNRQRRVMETQSAVVPGQRVRTTAGMYGTITAVEDGDVVIEVAPGVEVRYLKRAIMDVLSDAPETGYHDDGSGMGTDTGTMDAGTMDGPDTGSSRRDRADEADPAPDGQAAEK